MNLVDKAERVAWWCRPIRWFVAGIFTVAIFILAMLMRVSGEEDEEGEEE